MIELPRAVGRTSSGDTGVDPATPPAGEVWRRSSRSNATGNCVEVANLPAGVAVRDSTDPDGPVLGFAAPAWCAFITDLGH